MIRRLSMLSSVLFVVLAGSLMACSVPVFRYAFEHWRPDAYLAVVFHRGELTEAQQSLLSELQPNGADGGPAANLLVKTVDLDAEPDEAMATLWDAQETETLPWLVVHAPPKQGTPAKIWAGEFNQQHTSALISSPMRQQLLERLLGGDSLVWLYLGSGDEQADDVAFELVQTQIDRLEQELKLPEIEEADLQDLSVDPAALKLQMSALRVSRNDPAEQFLVEVLLRVEPDLLDESIVHQPMAFPVFGRGRALYALVGEGIVPDTIEEACRFLTGACQCTVKSQNPGVDLLLSVDWDQAILPALPYDTTPPTLAGLTGFAEPERQPATGSSEPVAPTAGTSHSGPAEEIVTIGDEADAVDSRQDSAAGTAAVAQAPAKIADGGSLPVAAAPSPSIAGNVLLVMGLLAMCVIVVSIVLIPRSR